MQQKPLQIQLAFQGGGAKIVSLLAAAEKVQELHGSGQLRVTRVAGTSAGAIAACLLASGEPLSGVRAQLQRLPGSEWKKLLPAISRSRALWQLLRDDPFWEVQPLRDFLGTFFDAKGLRTLGDLKKKTGIQVFVVAADVTNSKPVVYEHDDEPIVNSLLDSSALPFVLRTGKNSGGRVVVDGGICENLPSEVLESGVQEFGQVIGISFASTEPGRPPANVFDFGRSLLETAINNSVVRARRRLGEQAVFSIDTTFRTFDFQDALADGLKSGYDLVKYKTEEYFEGILQVRQGDKDLLVGDPWRHGDIELMAKLSEVYRLQHEPTKLEYIRSSLVVHANCLLPPEDPRRAHPDLIKHILVFKPVDRPVYCHKLGLSSTTGSGFLGRASWSVRDKDGEERRTVMLPILDPKRPRQREVVLFFDPVIEPGEDGAPFTLTLQDLIQDSMVELGRGEESGLAITPLRTSGSTGRLDLVLFVPQSFPEVRMAASRLADGSPGPPGRAMTANELTGPYEPPPGFRALGWTGTAPQAGIRFGVDLWRADLPGGRPARNT